MSDKELLEAAAKAAGYSIHTWFGDIYHTDFGRGVIWNPLKDDGDAFRLAVDLGLTVIDGMARSEDGHLSISNACGDNYAATRIAIVMEAARMGIMKE